jgi:TPR repeat protein
MASRLLMIVALVAAAYGADAAQDKPAPKRSSPAATERAKPEQNKPEPTLEQRATQGDREAQFEMGERLRLGTDVAADRPMALMWYFRAAEQGHEGAGARVAEMTKRYAPVEPPPSEATTSPARDREPSAPVPPQTRRDYLAIALALMALVVSAAAVVISRNRTKKALQDAGLL